MATGGIATASAPGPTKPRVGEVLSMGTMQVPWTGSLNIFWATSGIANDDEVPLTTGSQIGEAH